MIELKLEDKRNSLKLLKVKQLKDLCRNNEIEGYSSLKKAELIEKIIDSLEDEVLKEILKKKGLIIKKKEKLKQPEEREKGLIDISKRKIDNEKYLKYLLVSLGVDDLKQICRDFSIRGYSRFKKGELIDFIIDSLAAEEISELIDKKELEIISEGIDLAIKKIKGEDRERFESLKIVNEKNHEIELKFKGFSWEIISFLSITPKDIDNPYRDCDCRVGANMGFCNHFWAGVIFSYKKGWFNLKDWTLTNLPDDFKEKIESIELSESTGEEEEIIMVDTQVDDYQLKIFENQKVTVYEGEIHEIKEKQSDFQGNITIWYLVSLKNVRMGPRVARKSDFNEEDIQEFSALNLRLSDRIMEDLELKIGDKIGGNGKLDLDNFLGIYIVKGIRKIERK